MLLLRIVRGASWSDIPPGSNVDHARIGEEPSPLLHPRSGPPAQVSLPAQSPDHLSACRLDSPQHQVLYGELGVTSYDVIADSDDRDEND